MSNTDKRSVATDALQTLGFTITENEKRDAIHLAVEPVIAVEKLHPGQHVGFVEGGVGVSKTPVGIVDPFIVGAIYPGQRFWLIVYPRQITSLRHVWTHPAFSETELGSSAVEIIPSESEIYLKWFADSIDVEYDELIEHATEYLDHGSYWSEGGRFEGTNVPTDFWEHFQNVTGIESPDNKRRSFFSCSC